MAMIESALTGKQPSRLPYASLADLRRAIQRRRLIRFHHRGAEVVTEPHLLGKGNRTGAYYVKCFGTGEEWTYYRFCEVRGLEETKDAFSPRRDVWDGERKIVELDTQARW